MKRHKKKVAKLRGKRTHGGGFSKNRRGTGSRMTNRRTYTTNIAHVRKYQPWRLVQKGFVSRFKRMKAVNLNDICKTSDGKEISLPECKVLGGGELSRPIIIKAGAFSKKALEKIKKSGGEAVLIK